MVFFPNEKVELWEYNEDGEIPNFFGETIIQYTHIGTFDVDFQPASQKDAMNDYGKTLEDTYKLYLDLSVPITDTMILRLVGKPDTYSIVGTPIFNNHNVVPHIKVIVQKQRQPTKLEV